LTGEGQSDSRSNGYRNKHRRYSADQVRVYTPNFAAYNNGHKTQTFILGIKVLRKIIAGEMLKIIIIKIIAIHLLLKL